VLATVSALGLALTFSSAPAYAGSTVALHPGRGIGKLQLGMTVREANRATGSHAKGCADCGRSFRSGRLRVRVTFSHHRTVAIATTSGRVRWRGHVLRSADGRAGDVFNGWRRVDCASRETFTRADQVRGQRRATEVIYVAGRFQQVLVKVGAITGCQVPSPSSPGTHG
jgi:hypothetical protein